MASRQRRDLASQITRPAHCGRVDLDALADDPHVTPHGLTRNGGQQLPRTAARIQDTQARAATHTVQKLLRHRRCNRSWCVHDTAIASRVRFARRAAHSLESLEAQPRVFPAACPAALLFG